MLRHSPHLSRLGGILLPLALVATLLSAGAISGQDSARDTLVAESAPVLASSTVTVLGDGFIAAPAVSPVRSGPCGSSEVGPVERAAFTSPDTAIRVDNRSCPGATLTAIASEQLDDIDPESALVIIGGIGLEFEWADLASACLDTALRSAATCLVESNLARATASNSFFSWRSVLQQVHRAAPDATIAVVAPPTPVGTSTLTLGSECCGQSTDAHTQIRGVFDTAGSLRRAVAESLPEIPIIVVETDVLFEGHRMDDDVPWLGAVGDAPGLPNALGVGALTERIQPLMPVGIGAEDVVRTPAEFVLVTGTTMEDADSIAALASAADEWFERLEFGDLNPSVAVVPIRTTPPQPDDADPEEPEDLEDPPVGEDSTVREEAAADPEDEQLQTSPLQADDAPTTTTTTTAPETTTTTTTAPETTTTTTTAPETTTTTEGVPVPVPVPTFATSAAELRDELAEVAPIEGATNFADLTASLTVAVDLLTPNITDRHIVVLANNIADRPLSDSEAEVLENITAALPDAVTIVVESAEQATGLADRLANTGIAVAVGKVERIDDLPFPEQQRELTAIVLPQTIEALRGSLVPVTAILETTRPTEAAVTWEIGDVVVGVGQRTSLVTDQLPDGTHEIVVTAQGTRDTISGSVTVTITSDGDGQLAGDGCPGVFDLSDDDVDGDGLFASCDADDDGDGLADAIDPCPTVRTDNLRDIDLDGRPDRCDADVEDGPLADADADGVANSVDNCPLVTQADQLDDDNDGIGNDCENQLSAVCTIFGTNGNDRIRGTSGPDVICALGGDDIVTSLDGDDIVFGGDGDDKLHGGADTDRLYGGDGDDTIFGNGATDILIGGFGNDTINGGYGADIIYGDRGADVLNGNDGPDIIMGGRGNDQIMGGPGGDTIAGERGNDKIFGEDGPDLIDGGGGSDEIGGGRGNDVIITVESFDFVRGGSETDIIDAAPIRVT